MPYCSGNSTAPRDEASEGSGCEHAWYGEPVRELEQDAAELAGGDQRCQRLRLHLPDQLLRLPRNAEQVDTALLRCGGRQQLLYGTQRPLMTAAPCRLAQPPCTRRTSWASPHLAGRSASRARRARPPPGGARSRAQLTR